MRDRTTIAAGLIVFAALALFPVWWNIVSAGSGSPPELEIPAGAKRCVEDKAFMTARHMELLDRWRDEVVRQGKSTYTSVSTGETYEMSLTKTCMECHPDRDAFCDRCHAYAGVHPYCWDCHMEPKGD
ncbi:MAG: sulfate reduction electron transfer complex DsrMKJOP subunit DsrJ [bacterium]